MDNIKNDAYYLNKMIEDLEFMILNTKGKSQNEIESNQLLVDSIMFRLIQVYENYNKLSELFKVNNSNIPCQAIKGMRNKIVHDYGIVNLDIVYDTVINSIPDLLKKLKKAKI